MNVLIVTYAYPPLLSGVAQIVEKTSQELKKRQIVNNLGILTVKTDKNIADLETTKDNIQIYRYKSNNLMNGRIPLPSIDLFKKLYQAIEFLKPDQIHIHTRFAFDNFIVLWIAKSKGIKVVHVEHLSNFIQGESYLVNTLSFLWDQSISKIIFRFSDKIIAISDSVKDFITQKLGAESKKITVIPNACRINPVSEDFHDKFKSLNTFNIFFAARFVALKNPILVIESLIRLSENQDFRFYLAGDGPQKDKLLDLIENSKLKNKTIFLGKLDTNEMQKMFDKSHLFINLSLLEGLPGSVLEALFSNNMCLVSNIGGNKDIIKVKECLLDVNQLKPGTVTSKIEYIIKNYSELISKYQANKDWAKEYFTWDRVISKYQNKIFNDQL